MSKLSYKIIDIKSTPKGKSRVYFCAHPKDYKKYFKKISDDILAISDCVIWFDTEPEAQFNEDEHLFNLKEMQLFVIPVTERLLNEKNRAINLELSFAIKNNIPVLPIMMDDGLDEVFYEYFGDMQYLKANSFDLTELPYEEKLKKFLSSILIEDELKTKICACFDAYIFLSYRKKDRKYAQELMRLIHSNPLCRDIAIWYDEFLTPGESFNASIENALKSSNLFALTVTPNLINEDNYVLNVEYPRAVEQGKIIFPVEMSPTDNVILKQKFKDIPDCVLKDDGKLETLLYANFKNIATNENKDPQHNFFIGLAYLNGIDVEVDHQRAVKLITFAAENGVTEAIEKLVTMFQKGEGVRRDYNKEYFWQQKLVETRKSEYNNFKTEETFENYAIELSYLGDCAFELGDFDGAENIRLSLLELCKNKEDNLAKFYLAQGYSKLASSKYEERDIEKSLYYRLLALEIYKLLADKNAFDSSYSDLALCYQQIGDLAIEIRNIDKAFENYYNALKIRKKIFKKSGTNDSLAAIADTYVGVAKYYGFLCDYKNALKNYKKAYKIYSELIKTISGEKYLYEYALSIDGIGTTLNSMKQFDKARKFFIEMYNVLNKDEEQEQSMRSLFNMSVAYERLGFSYLFTEDLKKAEENMKKAFALRQEYCSKTRSVDAKNTLGIITTNLGRIYYFNEDFIKAREFFKKGYDIAYELQEQNPSNENYENLAEACFALGAVDEENQQNLFKSAYKIWEELSNQFPQVETYKNKARQVKEYIIE